MLHIRLNYFVSQPNCCPSWRFFGKERRKLLAQKYPQFSNKQISKILGQQWKSLSVEMKKHYHNLAEEAEQLHKIKYPGIYHFI